MLEDVAVNEIQKQFDAAFPSQALAIVGSAVTYAYDDEPFNEPDPPAYWAHVEIMHGIERQLTMGGLNGRKFLRPGTITVTISGPAAGAGGASDGRKIVDQLASVIATSVFNVQRLAAAPGDDGVILHAASPKELGSDGRWFKLAVLVAFEYTTFR